MLSPLPTKEAEITHCDKTETGPASKGIILHSLESAEMTRLLELAHPTTR